MMLLLLLICTTYYANAFYRVNCWEKMINKLLGGGISTRITVVMAYWYSDQLALCTLDKLTITYESEMISGTTTCFHPLCLVAMSLIYLRSFLNCTLIVILVD